MGRTYVIPAAATTLSSTAGAHSLILLNPVNTLIISEVGISFNASAPTAGVEFDLYRTTTVGSPAGTTTTPVRANCQPDQAATTTALTVLTTEPTAVELIRPWYLQPFGGPYVFQYPLGREPDATGALTQRLGLRYTTVSGVTPSCLTYIEIEE
jgi:hypothetical protein